MSEAFERIKRGLKEAIAYARGDCKHEWVREWRKEEDTARDGRKTFACTKCKVKITRFEPVQ